jgi:hypothetical protein
MKPMSSVENIVFREYIRAFHLLPLSKILRQEISLRIAFHLNFQTGIFVSKYQWMKCKR